MQCKSESHALVHKFIMLCAFADRHVPTQHDFLCKTGLRCAGLTFSYHAHSRSCLISFILSKLAAGFSVVRHAFLSYLARIPTFQMIAHVNIGACVYGISLFHTLLRARFLYSLCASESQAWCQSMCTVNQKPGICASK